MATTHGKRPLTNIKKGNNVDTCIGAVAKELLPPPRYAYRPRAERVDRRMKNATEISISISKFPRIFSKSGKTVSL